MTTNRLARETSPYLRQHAHNPVDWFAWGDEAIAKARAENKPLFVSVGYSTCYWCHVMERESFESEEIAAMLERDFVSVKVDREERPDIDDVMMSACQVYTSMTEGRASGGWPLTVFLAPDTLRPFFAGTYFPPSPGHGRMSFAQLLEAIADAWRERNSAVRKQGDAVFAAVQSAVDASSAASNSEVTLHEIAARTALALQQYEDKENGGFGGAPKFPQPAWLELMHAFAGEMPSAGDTLARALRAISLGGIHDHLGGGFHRYAVDRIWRVPHFEKMLYDSSQLVTLMAASGDPLLASWLARAARRALGWMSREMLRADGLFHAALDAEVDGQEGLNFLWTAEEMRAVLAPDDAVWAQRVFGLDDGANFQDPHHRNAPATNVLFLAEIPAQIEWPRLDRVSDQLLQARALRKQPRTDFKAILGWNALAIRAFAQAGRALGDADLVAQASRSFEAAIGCFLEFDGGKWFHGHDELHGHDDLHGHEKNFVPTLARAWRVRREGLAPYAAQLEDVAALAHAATALHAATGEARYGAVAWAMVDFAVRIHLDADGRWCERPGVDEWGLRGRGLQDGAVPGGAGTMALALAALATTGPRAAQAQELLARTLAAATPAVLEAPTEAARTLIGAHRAHAYALPKPLEFIRVEGIGAARTLVLGFAPGWHISALPTVSGPGIAISAPSPVNSTPAHIGGVVRLGLQVAAGAHEGTLQFQPCDEHHCLAPMRLRFIV